MFTVMSSWNNHCNSSPDSCDECRTVATHTKSTNMDIGITFGGYGGTRTPHFLEWGGVPFPPLFRHMEET